MIVDDFSDVSSWAFVWSCCLSLCLPQVEIASLVWFAEDQEDCPRCQWALLSSSDNWGKPGQGWNHWQPKTWTGAAWSGHEMLIVMMMRHYCQLILATSSYPQPTISTFRLSHQMFSLSWIPHTISTISTTSSASLTKHSSSLMKCFLNQGYLQISSASMSLAGVSVYSDVTNFRRVLSISSLSHVPFMICVFILN